MRAPGLTGLLLAANTLYAGAADLARRIAQAGLDSEQCYRIRDLTLAREDVRFYFTDGHILFGKPEFHLSFDLRQQFVQRAGLIAIEFHYLRNRHRSISVGVEPFERILSSIICLESLRDLVGGVWNPGTQ